MQRIVLAAVFIFTSHSLLAKIHLPKIFSDNMVLQHGMNIHVWGTAEPGQALTVSLYGDIIETKATSDGNWEVWYSYKQAGQNGQLIISDTKEKIVFNNVMIGEVWICSGQSNMEYPLGSFKGYYEKEIKASASKWIRFATVQNLYHNQEQTDADMRFKWREVNENTVGDCSAVAYFFARKLFERTRVPVGIIITSWGGTPAEAWMDETGIQEFKNYQKVYEKSIKPIDFSKLDELKRKSQAEFQQKKTSAVESFSAMKMPGYDAATWEEVMLPGIWESAGHPDFDGLAAYRIEFTVSPADAGKAATLHLPAIDDIDSTYINGQFIGTHTVWNELRTYKIAPGILKAGKNVLAIWVEDGQGGGGLNNDPANYYLDLADKKIPLKGPARLKLLLPLDQAMQGVNLSALQNAPCVLFNAMIAPLLPMPFRGVIWYQGESNVSRYEEYRTLFPALISRWRKRFGRDDIMFLFAQLSSYNPAVTEPLVSEWALLREAQTMALQLPNTGMAVTTDVGDQFDIHPIRKKEVGERLAAQAMYIKYGFKNEIPSGPVFSKAVSKNGALTIEFSSTGKGLFVKGDKLLGFDIAGADKVYHPAEASVNGDKVVVKSVKVAQPVYVRYAWADAPLQANLYNIEGFPAVPFRTDK